tara:strand:- start:162 stop:362 length:201 start_codon:yes stop_codon:yes gene_type:complete
VKFNIHGTELSMYMSLILCSRKTGIRRALFQDKVDSESSIQQATPTVPHQFLDLPREARLRTRFDQ